MRLDQQLPIAAAAVLAGMALIALTYRLNHPKETR